ncbi:MAG: helix-turn-helix domain-containing protein [Gammaproteobacteria bacterium]
MVEIVLQARPELSPDLIARELGLSRSRLFALTRQFGTSVRRLIIDTRLDLSRAALADPAWAHCTVTELAFAFGFQDLAHFSRRFTARFGVSPRASRGGGRLSGGSGLG